MTPTPDYPDYRRIAWLLVANFVIAFLIGFTVGFSFGCGPPTPREPIDTHTPPPPGPGPADEFIPPLDDKYMKVPPPGDEYVPPDYE